MRPGRVSRMPTVADQRPTRRGAAVVESRLADQLDLDGSLQAVDGAHHMWSASSSAGGRVCGVTASACSRGPMVSGAVLAHMWTASPDEPGPDPVVFQRALTRAVQIGFERTQRQDAALGIRQLVDMACKALSPAVNDPYTAVQAIDHLSVIFRALAVRPLGDDVAADPARRGLVILPGRRFGDYLATMCGPIRRYGCAEPIVALALLGLLDECAAVLADDPARWAAVGEQADLIVADATRETAQSADLTPVVAAAADLSRRVARHPPEPDRQGFRAP